MAIMGMSVRMAYNWYSNMYGSTTAFKRCVSPGHHNDLSHCQVKLLTDMILWSGDSKERPVSISMMMPNIPLCLKPLEKYKCITPEETI
jgi:hypothetical protein